MWKKSNHLQSLSTSLEQYQTDILIQGQSWNVFEAGADTPIIFLHNGGGILWNWVYQLEYFAKTHRVIAPDLPGFGNSHRPSTPLTLESYVQGTNKLLEVLNCPKPILVGNCIGSSIALEFALRSPEKVRALALFNICGGLPMLNSRLQFWAALNPFIVFGKTLHRTIIDMAEHPQLQRFGINFLYANGEPELHPMIRQTIKLNPKRRASLYWLVMGLDSFSIFSKPRQKPTLFPPVLLGWGHKIKHWM